MKYNMKISCVDHTYTPFGTTGTTFWKIWEIIFYVDCSNTIGTPSSPNERGLLPLKSLKISDIEQSFFFNVYIFGWPKVCGKFKLTIFGHFSPQPSLQQNVQVSSVFIFTTDSDS